MKHKFWTALAALGLTLGLSVAVVSSSYAHGNHKHEEVKPHQQGVFEDSEVKDRTLEDWSGDWQSVYPYMEKGELDMVMRFKANSEGAKKTFDEYKEYYLKGYKTDISRIEIDGASGKASFYQGDKAQTATYKYEGYKILTYQSGKKGVRYLFTKESGDEGAPKYFQFSDHEIAPTKAEHFHIFMGNDSHDKLLEEMENWPTYYPSNLDVYEIIDEMIGHS